MSATPVSARSEAAEEPLRDFKGLYRREFAFVWGVARSYGVPLHALDDVVQDVFLTAYRRLDQLHFEVSARAWLHGVTRRLAARYRRGEARRTRRHDAFAAAGQGPRVPPQERFAAAQEFEQLLEGLGGRTRAVFEMYGLLGMSGPEIASELELPLSTVYSRIRLARAKLVREYGAEGVRGAVEGAREPLRPPREAVARGWVLLAPGITTGASAGVGAALGLVASVRGAIVLILVLAAGTIAWPRLRPEPAKTSTEVLASAPDSDPRGVGVQASPVAETPDPTAVDEGQAALPHPRPKRAARRTEADPLKADQLKADQLKAEVALLDRARDALASGDLRATRENLGEHARLFPQGTLADLRAATEIELLCREGAAEEAEAQALQFTRSYEGAAVAQRFTDFTCERL